MNLVGVANRVRKGETVTFVARGGSMTPKIEDGASVTVAPVDPATVKRGDIVLVRVGRNTYLHLVSAVQPDRVQISNNHGRVNGWTHRSNIYGIKQ